MYHILHSIFTKLLDRIPVLFLDNLPISVKTCPQNWIQNPYTKSCLLFVNDDVTQKDAVADCQNLGGSLAILDSQEEMTWFFNYREAVTGKLNMRHRFDKPLLEPQAMNYLHVCLS